MNKIISLDSLHRLIIIPLKRLIDKKIDKVDGKGLSTNDYTNLEKEKLANLSTEGLATEEYVDNSLNILVGDTSVSDQIAHAINSLDIITDDEIDTICSAVIYAASEVEL